MAVYGTVATVKAVPTTYDAAIVGLGPTGATLAILLARCGLRTLVVEREASIYDLPRAVHFDDETMRIFQSVGIADKLSNVVRVNPGMRFVDTDGKLLLDWPRPQTIGPHGWHASYRLHQPDLERLLRDALKQYTHCDIVTGALVTGLRESAETVTLRFEHNGELKEATAKYVIGCDGANSTVRQSMQTELHNLGFKERWLVTDLLLKQNMPELGDHTIQYCDPTQPMTYCRNPGLRRRWEMALPESVSDKEAVSESRIWQRLARWVSPDTAAIERRAVYTFRSAVAVQWRKQRVLIAGDAAHLTPPFMGQGMCAGIRDASNLAWKIAAVVDDTAHHSLLDTYQAERERHVREYITTAVKLGELINSVDQDTAATLSTGPERSTMASPAPPLGSVMSAWLQQPPSILSGCMFPQPELDNERRLDDATGYGFALISSAAFKSPAISVIDATQHANVQRVLHELKATAILIRPDRYIALTAQSNEELLQLREAIARLPLTCTAN